MKDNTQEFLYTDSSDPVEISVGKNSQLQLCTFSSANIHIKLIGEGAQVQVNQIFFGVGGEKLGLSAQVEHLALHTVSTIQTYGVLAGRAEARIQQKIIIAPEMPGCSGQEDMHTLIISADAKVHGLPELEIGNNDVRCGHRATTTRLNPEKLFYLESRGFDQKSATETLVMAHLTPVLEKIEDMKVRNEIENKIQEKLAVC